MKRAIILLFALTLIIVGSTCANKPSEPTAAAPASSPAVYIVQHEQLGWNDYGTYVVVIEDSRNGARYATVCNRGCGQLVALPGEVSQ